MNHVYRLVFNASLGTWVAAPDFARGAGKAAARRRGAGAVLARGALALALAAAFPAQAQAQTRTWLGLADNYFNNANNWAPTAIPGLTATAVFTDAGATDVVIRGTMQHVQAFQFDNNAQAYSFQVSNHVAFLNGGIFNNSANTQTFNLVGGTISFAQSTAGNATINGGSVQFQTSSTGGTATLNAQHVFLSGRSTLQDATVNVDGPSGSLSFSERASGGRAAVTLGDDTYLAFSSFDPSGTTIGSLSGSGEVRLGAGADAKVLAIGGNDRSTIFSGRILGDGAIVKEGTGTLTLAGNNGYTGTTTIAAGTLQVGNGTGTGSLGSGDVVNNGALVFRRTGTVTVANNISGSGRVEQRGSGILELLGSNTYAGSTYITGGGEIRFAAGSLGGALVEVQGGRLRALDSMTLGQAFAFAGGTNGLAVSDGHLLTVTGRTDIVGPATTLRLGAAGAVGSIRLEGELQLLMGTLDVNGVTTHISNLQGFGTLTSNGALADVTVESGDFENSITGNIALTKAGTDLLILSGRNTYTGATTIAGGTLRLRAEGALATGTAVTLHGDGYLQLEGYDQAIGSLEGTSETSFVDLGGATLTVGSNNADTGYAGGMGGGALVKTGAGNLTLSGDNYLASTRVSAGTLTVGDGGNSGALGPGDVTNNATLAFNRGDDIVVDNTITGTGRVRKLGAGTLTLTGSNGYSGGTAIDAGTLSISADDNIGTASGTLALNGGTLRTTAAIGMARTVTLAGNGTFEVQGTSLTLGGAVGGSGNLVKEGPGTLILSADNSYAGTTTVSSGMLQVGDGGPTGSLGAGAVTNNGQLTFHRNNDFTVANAIGGTGPLTKQGLGTMTLTGSNSYAGSTTITEGTLQVGDGGTTGSLGSGNVTNNGALAFNRSDTVSLANVISGTGSLTQAGGGNLVLTGANTYTGGTFVNAGTLSVNGSIVGSTTVNNGGTLGGAGSVGSVAIASGGTLAPGNSIGTLNVNGNLSFAPGSVYRVEANAAGAADRVNAVGAGTITINGGTVDVQAGGAGYQRNTNYTILSSGGATTGQFSNVTSNLAFLTPTLIYQANGVLLNLQASDALSYASVARTPNQTAVANYLQGIANTPGDAAALIQQFDNMTADQASASFESMAGSAHASASQVASALGRNFSATLASRSGFSTSGLGNAMNDWSQVRYASLAPVETSLASAQERGLWAQALGAGGRMDSDGNAAGSRYRNSGLVLGYDQPVTGQWLAGGAVGYSTSWWNATSGDPSSGKIESPQAGLYARYTTDSIRVRLDGTFSSHDFTTDRTVNIAGVGATANSKHKGREWGLGAQVEMPIKAGEWEVRPLAGLRYAHLNEDGFNETGQSPANLAVAERTTQNTLLSAGMHFVRPFNQGKAGLELRAVASHLAGDNDSPVTASLIGQPGSFTATGVPLKRNALTLGTTVSGQFTRNVSAYLDANYEVRGSGQNAHQLTGGLRVTF